MWSKSEAKAIKSGFWTALGQYLSPIPSAEGERIHWINYNTGKKGISIKLLQEDKSCCTQLQVHHQTEKLRQLWWQQLLAMKADLPQIQSAVWVWDNETQSITASITNVNILLQQHWPQCISFYKESLLALDAFWCTVKWYLPDEADII